MEKENLTSMNHSFPVAHQMSAFSCLKNRIVKQQEAQKPNKMHCRVKQEKTMARGYKPKRFTQERKRKKFKLKILENTIRQKKFGNFAKFFGFY